MRVLAALGKDISIGIADSSGDRGVIVATEPEMDIAS
jgi:hypothetical protein